MIVARAQMVRLVVLVAAVIGQAASQQEAVCPAGACTIGDCAQATFSACSSIKCDNMGFTGDPGTCQSSVFENDSTVACSAGACQHCDFVESDTTCSDGSSCDNSEFNKTLVTCNGDSCDNSNFHTSAVTCSSYDSCDLSIWTQCSCCDGAGCSSGATSCHDLDGFCAIEFLGRTCKEWGNPICDSVPVTETGVSVTICDSEGCAATVFSDAFVYCDNKYNTAATKTCQSTRFQNSEAV